MLVVVDWSYYSLDGWKFAVRLGLESLVDFFWHLGMLAASQSFCHTVLGGVWCSLQVFWCQFCYLGGHRHRILDHLNFHTDIACNSFVVNVNQVQLRTNTFVETVNFGWGQNMDQGSMDPHFGPGPWTTFMDRVHGQIFFNNEKWTKTGWVQK